MSFENKLLGFFSLDNETGLPKNPEGICFLEMVLILLTGLEPTTITVLYPHVSSSSKGVPIGG